MRTFREGECRVESAEYNRKYRKEIRVWLDKEKLKCGCVLCGYKIIPQALDYHHVAPHNKKRNGINVSYGFNSVLKEMKKCVLLCKNCHTEVHSGLHLQEIFDIAKKHNLDVDEIEKPERPKQRKLFVV